MKLIFHRSVARKKRNLKVAALIKATCVAFFCIWTTMIILYEEHILSKANTNVDDIIRIAIEKKENQDQIGGLEEEPIMHKNLSKANTNVDDTIHSATKKKQNQDQFGGLEEGPIIDAVFTYVNGSDPGIQAVWKQFGRKISHGRIRDYGQVRYAMRSAFMHAPFIRNFILIISSKETQIPSWLDTSHPQVKVIEHQDIWDNPSNLPSSNSHAIEWAITNIPDVAPLLLYFNDDFSIQKKLELSSIWNSTGQFILHEAWDAPKSASEVGDEYGKSLAFVRKLYDRKYGFKASRKVGSHIPMLFNTTIMKMIKSDWPKEFEDMYRNKPFRTPKDMQLQFAYQQYIRHHFPFKIEPDHLHFKVIQSSFEANKRTFAAIEESSRQYICLQDAVKQDFPSTRVLNQIEQFYENMFPTKAPWEISQDSI